MFQLRIEPAVGEPFDSSFPEDQQEIVIGRASDSGLVIADRFLSRHHARLFREDDRLFVEDLGSRNGTLVNDRRIEGRQELRSGDVLKLSGSVIRLHGPAPSSSTAALGDRDLGGMTVLKRASDLLVASGPSDTSGIEGEENLRRFAERLKLLNEVHSALGRSIELDELLELILERAFEHLKPEEGAIFLKREDAAEEYALAARRTLSGGSDYLYSRTLVREVADKGLAALAIDAQTDERFAEAQSIMASGVRSLVAAPLLDPEGSLGLIVLSSRAHVKQFSEPDLELLTSLASVAALRIRNVALAEEAAERRELARELELARHIQLALLPDQMPEIPGYELSGGNIPSRGVSGDFYEVVPRADGSEFVFLVTDVSGKGMSASLLAAAMEALVAGPIEEGLAPEEICRRASRLLYQRTPPERYATAIMAALEPASGALRYVNAGHVPGLVVRASGEVEQLPGTGLPIGLLLEGSYSAGETTLGPGDTLILYTDGLNEAENAAEEQYGVERLAEVCNRHRELPLAELASRIDDDLQEFAGEVPFADDRTLVMARRRAG